MNLKKRALSPILTIIAMIFLLISRLISETSIDWLGYLAIPLIIASVISLILMHKKSK